jgi:nucleoside-diphosphate-sugar epimerase
MNRLGLLEDDGRYSLRGIPTSKLADKTILITGASGLVGTHFLYGLAHCQEQLGLLLKVVAVVQRGVPDHLKQLEQQGYARFLQGDMTEISFFERLPQAHVIIHAATYGQPGLFTENAVATLRLNTTSVFALLEKLLPEGQFLFLSSSEVYSGLTNPPFSEDQIGTTNTSHPRSCYIEAKRCGEAICNAYRGKGVDVKCARLCLAYGPGTRRGDKRVINSFIERALREKAIRLLDRGEAKRTYCYVADAVHMMWRILLEGKDLIYNVGGTSSTTIVGLAQLIGRLLDVPVHIPLEKSDEMVGAPDDVRLDLTKFTNEFGPKATVDFQEGLARTVEWQKAFYSK